MIITLRNGKHRKNVVKTTTKSLKSKKVSKGFQKYQQTLRANRNLLPYRYRDAQKLASEMYRS